MFAQSVLATLLLAAPFTRSVPLYDLHISINPYNCGYVRTRWNSSVVAGIFAYGACKPFYYNETIGGYQDAYAYTLYGGCDCRFYSYVPKPFLTTRLSADLR